MRLPIGILPSLTRRPPNQNTATLDRLRIAISTGMARAKIRLTRNAVAVRSALAVWKRRRSDGPRKKARMTRTPVICSRSTWLMRSILACIDRNSGTTAISIAPITTAMTGTATASSGDSAAPSLTAMKIPPTHMIGAMTMSVRAICKNS